jgi:hypothetical protein
MQFIKLALILVLSACWKDANIFVLSSLTSAVPAEHVVWTSISILIIHSLLCVASYLIFSYAHMRAAALEEACSTHYSLFRLQTAIFTTAFSSCSPFISSFLCSALHEIQKESSQLLPRLFSPASSSAPPTSFQAAATYHPIHPAATYHPIHPAATYHPIHPCCRSPHHATRCR